MSLGLYDALTAANASDEEQDTLVGEYAITSPGVRAAVDLSVREYAEAQHPGVRYTFARAAYVLLRDGPPPAPVNNHVRRTVDGVTSEAFPLQPAEGDKSLASANEGTAMRIAG